VKEYYFSKINSQNDEILLIKNRWVHAMINKRDKDSGILQVVSGPSAIEHTLAWVGGNGGDTYQAGQDWVQIKLQAVDAYGNQQDHVLSQIDGFKADIMQPDNTLAMVAFNPSTSIGTNGNSYISWSLSFLPLQASEGSEYIFVVIWRNDSIEVPLPSLPIRIHTVPGALSPMNTQVLKKTQIP